MNAPRWFYVVVAVAISMASLAVTYRALRPADEWVAYHVAPDDPSGTWLLNTRTHTVCIWNGGGSACFDALAKRPGN